MVMPRHFRRRMAMRPNIKSYKKILYFAPVSVVPGLTNDILVTGADSLSPGQANQTDGLVPTGSNLKLLDIQFNMINTSQQTVSIVMSLQHLRAGQSAIDPRIQGGNPQRNQVHFTKSLFVGENQQVNTHIRFRVPNKFQRVREGDVWAWTYVTDNPVETQNLVIYKFFD